MINIRELKKDFDGNQALKGINMNVKDGSIYGLVGTNGSGKTTILRILNGIVRADDGAVEIDGISVYDNPELKERIAFIPDELSFFNQYNLKEARKFYSNIFKRWDDRVFYELVNIFQLNMSSKIRRFSKGMQKQAVFALVMGTTPDYLILDEPIDGLDPIIRQTVWKYIVAAAADRQMTTLISSHNLREMEGYCDCIGVIDGGLMKLERDLDELKTGVHKLQVSFGNETDSSPDRYSSLRILDRQISGSVDVLIVKNDIEELDKFKKENNPILFDVVPLTLEEVFIYELGGEANADKIIS